MPVVIRVPVLPKKHGKAFGRKIGKLLSGVPELPPLPLPIRCLEHEEPSPWPLPLPLPHLLRAPACCGVGRLALRNLRDHLR